MSCQGSALPRAEAELGANLVAGGRLVLGVVGLAGSFLHFAALRLRASVRFGAVE